MVMVGGGGVYCYQADSGTKTWGVEDMELHGSIGLAGELLFFGEYDGDSVYAMDQATGATVWTYGIPGGLANGFQSSPSIVDGIMYIAATDGNLYAFGTGMKYTYLDDLYAQVGSNELIVTSYDGGAVAADTISFAVSGTGVNLDASHLLNLSASPNPFVSTASLTFNIAEPRYTTVNIFDLTGRCVTTLLSSELATGPHAIQWNGRDESGEEVSAGLYLCRIQYGEVVETTGLCLLR